VSTQKLETHRKILESALRLLTERGYHGVGLEEVARDAGLSRQAVYLHFKSKADLLVATAQYLDSQVGTTELLRPVFEAENAVEAMDRAVEAYAAIEPLIYDAAIMIYVQRGAELAAEDAWQDRMEFRRQNVLRGITALEAEGMLALGWTVEEATDFVWTLLSVHTYEYLVRERKWSIERFIDRLRQVLHAAIVAAPPKPAD
jgi:AcrR family transcriptional regulator